MGLGKEWIGRLPSEAIGRYRAMIARVIVSPDTTKQRGAVVHVVRQMDEILSLATGHHVTA